MTAELTVCSCTSFQRFPCPDTSASFSGDSCVLSSRKGILLSLSLLMHAILRRAMCSNYCVKAAIIWVSASLLVAIFEEVTKVVLSRLSTFQCRTNDCELCWWKPQTGSEETERWRGAGGSESSLGTYDISGEWGKVPVVGQVASASLFMD